VTATALASPEVVQTAPAPLIVADGLSRRFGDRWAVAGVNLRLSAGRSLLLAGHNGAGKSTLLHLLAGLLRPTAGTLTLGAPGRPRPSVGLIGHRGGHWQDLGALEHLRIDAKILGRRFDPGAAARLLARVGLDGRGREPVRQFSAGMSKRLSLARLLHQDPDIVLLDEPYGKLDHDGTKLMDAVVEELIARKKALVMATHLVNHVAHRLQLGLVLDGGQMSWVGPAADVPAVLAREEETG